MIAEPEEDAGAAEGVGAVGERDGVVEEVGADCAGERAGEGLAEGGSHCGDDGEVKGGKADDLTAEVLVGLCIASRLM